MSVLEGYVEGMLSGGGGGGSNVTIEPTLESGTKIADYTIDDESGSLYAPTPTTFTAGDNVEIENGVISATDTTYTAGDGITIENGVISATGGSSGVNVCILKIQTYAMSGETLTLTDENLNTIVKNVTTNVEVVSFQIGNAGVYTLTNSKTADSQTFNINLETGIVADVSSIIPVLSTNIGTNGTAIAPSSDPNYSNGNGYFAFDDNFSTWLEYLGENQSGAYVGYIFNSNVYIDNLVAYMGNYNSANSYRIYLELTSDGETWESFDDFVVSGYNSGYYGTFTHNIKRVVRGFRYKSTQEKTGGNNWYTYEIICNGTELS